MSRDNKAVIKVIDLNECRQYVVCNDDNQSSQRMQLIGFTDAPRESINLLKKRRTDNIYGFAINRRVGQAYRLPLCDYDSTTS